MGMKSRRKGKIGEREVAELLRDYGFEGKRGVQYKGDADSPDVIGLPGFHIEVKRAEQFNLYAALYQARRDCKGGAIPIVLHRRNGREWVVVISATSFLTMVAGGEQN